MARVARVWSFRVNMHTELDPLWMVQTFDDFESP